MKTRSLTDAQTQNSAADAGTQKLTRLALTAIEDLKGLDLRTLDVRGLTAITDAMVICTGTSSRHVKSIAEHVVEKVKGSGARPRGVEGLEQGEWVLVDLGAVVVHVMQLQARAFYQLEKLWDLEAQNRPAAAAV